MVGHGGSSAGSYLADPTSPIPSHCASIVATSTVRVNCISCESNDLISCFLLSVTAIKSLDHLNEQVLQFMFSPSHNLHTDHDQLSSKDRETLKTSMILMRHLLVDAQTKFRKMVDDNQRLAARIDGSIHAANQEVVITTLLIEIKIIGQTH